MAKREKKKNRFGVEDVPVLKRCIDNSFGDDGFRPKDVVAIATPRRHPLHKYFEWDNNRAGHLYRCHQARRMINVLRITINGVSVPEYVSVRVKSEPLCYMKVTKVTRYPTLYSQVLDQAKQMLFAWQDRFQNLAHHADLTGVFAEITKLRKRR